MKKTDRPDDFFRAASGGITRRDFLWTTALAAIGGRLPTGYRFAREGEKGRVAGRVRKGEMTYRRLGRTGLMISEIGLGGSPPPSEPVFLKAIEMGVNYVDTSSSYSGGNSERLIGRIIKGRRDRIHVATKFHFYGGWRDTRDDLIREAEGSLSRLATDYQDILLLHDAVSADVVENEEVLGAFEKLKKDGKIRFTGVSCHRDIVGVVTPAIRSGRYDMVTVAYNSYSGAVREEDEGAGDHRKISGVGKVLALAREKDVGVVAMKTMAGGSGRDLAAFRTEGVSLPQAKLKWVLRNDAVSAIITEMFTFDILEENLAASGKTLSDAEKESLRRHVEATGRDICRMCGGCLPACPSRIAIPDILRSLMYHRDYGKSGQARSAYRKIPAPNRGTGCTGCGSCERACPYGVRIVPQLRMAERRFA